jgi:DNA-binding beta-propeller fold protein YncE
VLVIKKRSAYVVRETAAPSHNNHPLGAEDGEPSHVVMEPVGMFVVVCDAIAENPVSVFNFISSVKLL